MKKHLFLVAGTALFAAILVSILSPACFNANSTIPENTASKKSFSAAIRELSDSEYPDNPDKSIGHNLAGAFSHKEIIFTKEDTSGLFSFELIPANDKSSHLKVSKINLLEWIPSVPDYVKKDLYMEYIGIINQEWNREQVSFSRDLIEVLGQKLEADTLCRIDLARNCLNAYLWEVFVFAKQNGEEKPIYHGWFNFPKELYAELFNKRNTIAFEKYRRPMETWVDPESKRVDLSVLRTPITEKPVSFRSENDEMYPVSGERKKKKRNIIAPLNPRTMQDFLNDSTEFATFSPPGFYNKSDPRHTQLSRLSKLQTVLLRKTVSNNTNRDTCLEVELWFQRPTDQEVTKLIIGGIKLSAFKQMPASDANKGAPMPMGIANHTFNQSYKVLMENPSKENPYFGLFTDEAGNWLDSHKIGIDGPIFHLDEKDPSTLHLWLLSFERHALVGHYVIATGKLPMIR